MTSSQENPAIVNGGPLDLQVTSVWQKLEQGYNRHPNGPAVISTHQPADHLSSVVGKEEPFEDDCLTWTYKEMRRGASRVAAALEAGGVKRGSVIMTMLPNSAEWSLFFWVTAMLQLTQVSLDPSLLEPARAGSPRYFLELMKPSAVVMPRQDQIKAFDKVYAETSDTAIIRVVCQSSQNPPPGWITLLHLAEAGTCPEESINITQDPTIERNGDRLATVLFTSGTSTGNPKGCPISVSNLSACAVSQNWYFNMDRNTKAMLHTVNFRAIHYLSSVGAWELGATVVLPEATFSARATLGAMEKHKGNWMICVPAQLRAIQADPDLATRNLSSLQVLVLAGDIATQGLIDDAKEIFPQARVVNLFGMSEGVGSMGWVPGSDASKAPILSHAMPVGKPLPGITIKVCDVQKHILPRNATGELHNSGSNMISGYFAGEQPESFYEEKGKKWIITGDRAMIDNSDFVFILGRSKDVIKKSGIPLSPTMIETFVGRTTGVQAQAFGIPDPTYGEEPFLVIKDSDPMMAESIAATVAASLGQDYILKGVLTLSQLGFQDFPTNPSGKIVKTALKEAVIAYLADF